MMKKLIFLFVVVFSISAFAQLKIDKSPKSFEISNFDYTSVPEIEKEAIDINALLAEDQESEFFAMRAGITKEIGLNIHSSGEWTYLQDGSRIWLQKFRAPNAVATSVYLKNLNLPEGAYLCFYNEDRTILKGAFTSNSFRNGNFTHEDVLGEVVFMELYEPANKIGQTYFDIDRLCYMYDVPQILKTSGSCNVDVACSESNNYPDAVKATVRIKIYKGGWVGWCSGTMMNNTAEDCRPLLLTAWHCGMGNGFSDPTANDLDNYLIYFNYQRPNCGTGTATENSLLGCSMQGNSQDQGGDFGSDFMLVELNQPIPWSYDVFYAGWNADVIPAPYGVSVHHPSGDYKKISTFNSTAISDAYGSATGSHWRVQWVATPNGHGVTEGGSSGSALFDPGSRVVGQLTGGGASCSNPSSPDLYGKMSYNWTSNTGVGGDQLKLLLDPINSGVLVFHGAYSCTNSIEENKETDFKMFPNPADAFVTLQASEKDFEVEIYSADGRKLNAYKSGNETEIQINVSKLESGVYLLILHLKEGTISRKLVVE